MLKKTQAKTIRRSFALSSKLIDEALKVAPPTDRVNLNKLVTIALQEYVNSKMRRQFENSMQAMGSDPEILRECGAIAEEFSHTENDGLSQDK